MDPASSFLANVPPFDRLPEADIELAARTLTKSHQLKDMTLCVQGKTRLRFVYIVIEGVLEQFILENGEKILRTYLHEHSIYGGLSLLFNAGLSIRTVRSIEDSTLYRLPRDIFLDICARNVAFTQHFTTLFSRKMQDRPYVAFIAKSAGNDPDAFASGFLNRPLADVFSKAILSCPDHASVQDAARMMTHKQRSAAAVLDPTGTAVGLITDNDIRSKIVAQDRPHSTKVRDIMSHPLITLPHDAGIFEAILLMMQHAIKHVAVLDTSSQLLGIASEEDLLLAQGQSPVFLMHEIRQAASVDELRARHQQLPGLIKSLTENGAKAEHLNRIISAVSDAILQRVIHGVLSEFPPPPADFAFMLLGSEGRQEQTLKTDQDNAIVFADQTPEREQAVQAYFLDLGRAICSRLDRIGYASCEFEIMAENPKWCQPLNSWKNTFQDWITSADPEALLHSSIFFDFRSGYGDETLVNELKDFLLQSTGGWMGFFRHLAENALHFKPPLDFFGNFALQGKGEHKNCLEIKTPMRLIVDFARIYALKNAIGATNTQERLRAMHDLNILDKEDFEDLYHAYSFMMQARIEHQLRQIGQNKPPDNFLDPKALTQIERQSLKEAFKRIRMAQGKMRMELTSATGIT
jgi:CBS domain-containing protein